MSSETLLFRSYGALAGWIFMAIWTSFLTVFTWIFLRDGGFHQFAIDVETAILLLFWVIGLAGLSYALQQPLVRMRHDPTGYLHVTQVWPWRRLQTRCALCLLPLPVITVHADSDGDHYTCVLTMPGAGKVLFYSHPDRQEAEASCARLAALIRQAGDPHPGDRQPG